LKNENLTISFIDRIISIYGEIFFKVNKYLHNQGTDNVFLAKSE
jgi:hypothetical protein